MRRQQTDSLQQDIQSLKVRLADLEKRFADIFAGSTPANVIVLRTITRSEAKQEIKDLFDTGGTWYYSDIVEKLRLDLPLVVELCEEMLREEEIQVDANVLQPG